MQTVSTAVQCSSLSDDILHRVAAGLVVEEQVQHHLAADSNSEDEDPTMHDPDTDFDPLAGVSDSEVSGCLPIEDQCFARGRASFLGVRDVASQAVAAL